MDLSICEKIVVERKKDACVDRLLDSIDDQIDDKDILEEDDFEDKDEKVTEDESKEENENEEEGEYGVIEKGGKLYLKSKPGEVLNITSSDLPGWAHGQIAVVGAMIVCVGPPNTIASGDSSVILNGLPAATINSKTAHGGSIVVGSDKIFINGVSAAVVGSKTVCPMVTGTVPHVGGPIINTGY